MKDIKLQYISQGNTPEEHLRNIEKVCKAGVRWIQLRIKNIDLATYLNTALQCREICDQYGAIMIVNDDVSVAKATLADGVHLGLEDMNPVQARKILGENSIIGGTANTLENCIQHIENKVDYIGLGPYKHTNTKKKLSPILGGKGYEKIISEIRNQNSEIPIIAIGGIEIEDVEVLIALGVSGIAVSGMLTNRADIKEKIENIKRLMLNQPEVRS